MADKAAHKLECLLVSGGKNVEPHWPSDTNVTHFQYRSIYHAGHTYS